MTRTTRDALRIAADGGPFQLNAIDLAGERELVRRLLRAAAEADEGLLRKTVERLERGGR
jgi:hypothetical protein